MKILRKRWILLVLLSITFVLTTACSCTDFIAGLGKSSQKDATIVPTVTPKPQAVVTPFIVPAISGTAFEGEFSEEQINDLIRQEVAQEAGEYVSDIQVSITTDALIATAQVSASDLNIKFGVTMSGVPVVVAGKVYLKVNEVTLDDTLSGWTRLTAKSMVQAMIDKYSGTNGIPIDIADVQIDEVQLRPGKLYVRGKTL
jgi:hypothetical protein